MRLIDADALEREGWYINRIIQTGKTTMEYQTKKPTEFPAIEPERKMGKWTNENACEFCGFQPWYERDIHTLSFCPNCGANMRGEQNDND